MSSEPTPLTAGFPLGATRVTVSSILPLGVYALMKGEQVVWDSATQLPPGLPDDPTRWDGLMVSPSDFERIKRGDL